MFKRVIWMGTGYGLGVGSSWWVKRKVAREVEKKVDRYVPPVVRDRAGSAVKAVNTRVVKANAVVGPKVQQGRDTLQRLRKTSSDAVQ